MPSRLDGLDDYYEDIMLGGILDGGQKEIPFQQAIVSCTPGLVAEELKYSVSCIFKTDLIMKTTMFLKEKYLTHSFLPVGGLEEPKSNLPPCSLFTKFANDCFLSFSPTFHSCLPLSRYFHSSINISIYG